MTDRWLVDISGLRLGPLDRADIQQMLDSGELRLDDRICREDSEDWHAAHELFDDDGDQLLTDSASDMLLSTPAPPTESRPAGRNDHHSISRNAVTSPSAPQSELADADDLSESLSATAIACEPMFFVQRDGDEVGPLSLSVVQQFVDEGLLNPQTPVRGEDDEAWTSAEDYGFEFPAVPNDEPVAETKSSALLGDRLRGGAIWFVFAPFFFVFSGGRSLSSLSRRQAVAIVVALVVIAFAGFHVIRTWSQTALTGRITLDGEPLADVMISLTGPATGDSGAGVSGSGGRFRIVTMDGELKPGTYQVTVHPLPTVDPNAERRIPEQYGILGMSDIVLEVTETTSTCEIELSSQRRLKRGRGYLDETPTDASVLE